MGQRQATRRKVRQGGNVPCDPNLPACCSRRKPCRRVLDACGSSLDPVPDTLYPFFPAGGRFPPAAFPAGIRFSGARARQGRGVIP